MRRKPTLLAPRPDPALVLAVVLMFTAPSLPAENDWTVRATGGLSWQADDDNNDFTDPAGEQNADASFDTGWTGGLSIGRWIGSRWRADLEWAYRSNDSDRIKLDDGRVADDGNYASTALSINGYYHFADGRAPRRWSPYVGAGLAWINEIDIDLEGRDFDNTYEDLEDDGFGVQVMGGLSWRQSERLRWDAELRWLYFGEADLENGSDVRLEGLDYAPVTLTIGLSYEF
jgi:opacity protein-like surface antigen